MKGFIEVTDSGAKQKYLISVAQIKFVSIDNDNNTYIALDCVDKKKREAGWTPLSFAITESYSEVVAKLEEAAK